jgi:hypothetical protein
MYPLSFMMLTLITSYVPNMTRKMRSSLFSIPGMHGPATLDFAGLWPFMMQQL